MKERVTISLQIGYKLNSLFLEIWWMDNNLKAATWEPSCTNRLLWAVCTSGGSSELPPTWNVGLQSFALLWRVSRSKNDWFFHCTVTPPVNRAPTLLLDLLVLHLSSFGIQVVNGTKFLSSTPYISNKYHVRDTLPIYPPTPGTFDSMPVLPSPPRKPAFDATFTLITHLFPATYLCTTRLTPFPKLPAVGATKEEVRRTLSAVGWFCFTTPWLE